MPKDNGKGRAKGTAWNSGNKKAWSYRPGTGKGNGVFAGSCHACSTGVSWTSCPLLSPGQKQSGGCAMSVPSLRWNPTVGSKAFAVEGLLPRTYSMSGCVLACAITPLTPPNPFHPTADLHPAPMAGAPSHDPGQKQAQLDIHWVSLGVSAAIGWVPVGCPLGVR